MRRILIVAPAAAFLAFACIQALAQRVGYVPKEGFVPSADVALSVANAVLIPVYGKKLIDSEQPFTANLQRDIWVITGTIPCQNPPSSGACPGGAAEVRISKRTGQILFMDHPQ